MFFHYNIECLHVLTVKVTYTNEAIETILLQLNPSNNYYTTGNDDVRIVKIGSTKVLVSGYTYLRNRTIFRIRQ